MAVTEIEELKARVEAQPEDFESRWLLAKKLYSACEYSDALHHLLVLKRDWVPRLNVIRYLAAACYRLGRYEAAVAELAKALEVWPNEISVRQQHARTLEMAGRLDEARAAWQRILEMSPGHRLARIAIQRVEEKAQSPSISSHLLDTDSGIQLHTGPVCPNCGAQNEPAFERCWQCHARLRPRDESASAPAPAVSEIAAPVSEPRPLWPLIGGLLAVALLTAGLYFTLRAFALPTTGVEGTRLHLTVSRILARDLMTARLIAGAVLFVLWPFILWSLLRALHVGGVKQGQVLTTGVFLTSLLYALSWAPLTWWPLMAATFGIVSLIVVGTVFPLRLGRALALWALQSCAAVLLLFFVLLFAAGRQPIAQFGRMVQYAYQINRVAPHGRHIGPRLSLPASAAITWNSTGSPWLDRAGAETIVYFGTESVAYPLEVTVMEDNKLVLQAYLEESAPEILLPVVSGAPYTFHVKGQQRAGATLMFYGVLTPAFEE